METKLTLAPSPHMHTSRTVRGTMGQVLIALLPAVAWAVWSFGLPALWLLAVCCGVCVFTEWAVTKWMLRRPCTIGDLSALVTGVLLALNLPPALPLWMAAAGSVMAIGIAKMAFGGLGCNIFNPALTGRVFLLISFPVAMTAWTLPAGVDGISGATVDATSSATLLALTKTGAIDPHTLGLSDFALGRMAGSMGEISAVALLAGFVYLLITRVVRWHIPAAVILGLVTVDLAAGYPPIIDILSGGLLLGAIFMATDYATSPMTTRGMLLYGFAIGAITAVIRRWGAYPEGMSFAILIMNAFTPLINRYIKPRRYSPKKKEDYVL